MKKKTNGTHMRLIIPIKKGIRCCCGCGKIFRFVPMWKIVMSNEYETTFTGAYFLLSHLRNDSPDDNKSLYELPSKELPIEALRASIKSIDDYLKLPYNIHLFTIHIQTYDGPHCFYVYRVQELPGCQASSEIMSDALEKLNKVFEDTISKYYFGKEPVPLPQQYDPNFVEWK